MRRIDKAAMQRAIEMLRGRGGEDRRQIEEMLSERGFAEAGPFAAYSLQCSRLALKPWMAPPCHAHEEVELTDCDDSYGNRRAEVELLRRLLAAGLSRWEPDPVAALKKAGAKAPSPAALVETKHA
jgi:hypothetical protein